MPWPRTLPFWPTLALVPGMTRDAMLMEMAMALFR